MFCKIRKSHNTKPKQICAVEQSTEESPDTIEEQSSYNRTANGCLPTCRDGKDATETIPPTSVGKGWKEWGKSSQLWMVTYTSGKPSAVQVSWPSQERLMLEVIGDYHPREIHIEIQNPAYYLGINSSFVENFFWKMVDTSLCICNLWVFLQSPHIPLFSLWNT